MDDIDCLQAVDYAQTARIKWDMDQDENSKFCYGMLKLRRRQQSIQGVMVDDIWCTKPAELKDTFSHSISLCLIEL